MYHLSSTVYICHCLQIKIQIQPHVLKYKEILPALFFLKSLYNKPYRIIPMCGIMYYLIKKVYFTSQVLVFNCTFFKSMFCNIPYECSIVKCLFLAEIYDINEYTMQTPTLYFVVDCQSVQ